VLLSSDAGADTLRALVAGGVAATRPKLGTEARTNGPFASSYHARVLPEFLDVVDDPGLKTLNGKGLVGAYDVDDEGVPAQAVKLVSEGRLENYLVSREPVRDFPQSNGHGRGWNCRSAPAGHRGAEGDGEERSAGRRSEPKAARSGKGPGVEERLLC